MAKSRLFQILTLIAVLGTVSSASASTTLKKLGRSPFYRQGVHSTADVKTLVKTKNADLRTGFDKAGYSDLFPAFLEQFPAATITPVKIAPGETFTWMLFRRKKNSRISVLKDVTWKGAAPFDAYRFDIDKGGMRYEFLVPALCGNVTLIGAVKIPPAPVAQAAAAPSKPAAPVAAPSKPAAPAPAPAPVVVVAAPEAPPEPAPAPAPMVVADQPAVVEAPAAVVAPPVAAPALAAARPKCGLFLDVGMSREPDPANYLFARVGYEKPLTGKLYLMGLLGGYVRVAGDDGGSAFTADALLDYHWLSRFSFGLGAGYWSGQGGQIDLIGNLGFRLAGDPEGRNCSLFLDVRLPADDLGNSEKFGRFGLGMRFRH